jgi:signal peptidase I
MKRKPSKRPAEAMVRRVASLGEAVAQNIISEWTITLILLLFGTTTLVQAFVIPSGSMEDTLLVGDHVLVDKLVYSPPGVLTKHLLPYSEVKRGDIIVLRYPPDISQTYVKRVIGIPGDRIRLVNKHLVLNGREIDEPYVVHKTDSIDSYRDNFPAPPFPGLAEEAHRMLEEHVRGGELIVPPGNYFAMGDNRDYSLDSRYWGLVPRENIIGKPFLVWWSYDAPGERLMQPAISLDHAIDLAQNFFTKTRWKRTLKLVRRSQMGRPARSAARQVAPTRAP